MRGSVLLAVCCFAACGGFAYLVYDAALPLERPLECGQPDGVLACPSDAATRARIDATVHKKNGSAIGRSPKHQRVHSKASTKSIHSKTKKEHHEKHPLKSKSRLPKKEKAQKKPQREPSSPSRIDIAEQKETALLRAAPDKGQQWTRSANRPRPLEAPRQIVRPAVKLDRNTGVHLALQKKLNWETADDLSKFGWKYGTDKSTNHRYTPYYHQVFTPVRNTTHTLLEVGVFKGESLKMWRDYFTNSMIYGIDYFRGNADGTWGELNRRVKLDAKFGPRIAMFDVNQSSIVEMERAFAEDQPLGQAAPYDIIVEDGSHMNRDQQLTFGQLFPLVRPGGIYVIEDTASSYSQGYDEKPGSPDTTAEVVRYFNATGRFLSKHLSDEQMEYAEAWIETACVTTTFRRRWDHVGMVRKRWTPKPKTVGARPSSLR